LDCAKIAGLSLTKEDAATMMHLHFPTARHWNALEVTHREYFNAVNRAVEFINEHLSEPVTLNDLADVAHISRFHFHRLFKAVMSESPGEYVRRLRLEKAVFKLQTTKQTVLEIAEQAGYQTPYALSKAFKKHFGMSPSDFRKRPSYFSTPLELATLILATPEIMEIPENQYITLRVVNPLGDIAAFIQTWLKLIEYVDADGIPGGEIEYIFLYRDIPSITSPNLYRAYACLTANPAIKPKGEFGKQTIEGGLYAVFTFKGAYQNLESLYNYIYRRWIHDSGYELRDVACFEKFLNCPSMVKPDDLLTEVYIPVKKLS
jgi:AraC family transcriptional regulator